MVFILCTLLVVLLIAWTLCPNAQRVGCTGDHLILAGGDVLQGRASVLPGEGIAPDHLQAVFWP